MEPTKKTKSHSWRRADEETRYSIWKVLLKDRASTGTTKSKTPSSIQLPPNKLFSAAVKNNMQALNPKPRAFIHLAPNNPPKPNDSISTTQCKQDSIDSTNTSFQEKKKKKLGKSAYFALFSQSGKGFRDPNGLSEIERSHWNERSVTGYGFRRTGMEEMVVRFCRRQKERGALESGSSHRSTLHTAEWLKWKKKIVFNGEGFHVRNKMKKRRHTRACHSNPPPLHEIGYTLLENFISWAYIEMILTVQDEFHPYMNGMDYLPVGPI